MEEEKLICQHIAYFGTVVKKHGTNSYIIGPGQIVSVLDDRVLPISKSPVGPKKFAGRNHSMMFHQSIGGKTKTIVVTHDHEAYAFENFRYLHKLGRIDKLYEKFPQIGHLKAKHFYQNKMGEWTDREMTLEERATSYLKEKETEKQVKNILKGKT